MMPWFGLNGCCAYILYGRKLVVGFCIQWWMLYVTKECQNQVKYDRLMAETFTFVFFAKFRPLQALIFAILQCAFCSLAPPPVIIITKE